MVETHHARIHSLKSASIQNLLRSAIYTHLVFVIYIERAPIIQTQLAPAIHTEPVFNMQTEPVSRTLQLMRKLLHQLLILCFDEILLPLPLSPWYNVEAQVCTKHDELIRFSYLCLSTLCQGSEGGGQLGNRTSKKGVRFYSIGQQTSQDFSGFYDHLSVDEHLLVSAAHYTT